MPGCRLSSGREAFEAEGVMKCVLWNDALGLYGESVWRPVVGRGEGRGLDRSRGRGTAGRVKEDYVGVKVVAPTRGQAAHQGRGLVWAADAAQGGLPTRRG